MLAGRSRIWILSQSERSTGLLGQHAVRTTQGRARLLSAPEQLVPLHFRKLHGQIVTWHGDDRPDRGCLRAVVGIFRAARAVASREDPLGLLVVGAPADEYDPEVRDLTKWRRAVTAEDLGLVFHNWFGSNLDRRPDLPSAHRQIRTTSRTDRSDRVPPAGDQRRAVSAPNGGDARP